MSGPKPHAPAEPWRAFGAGVAALAALSSACSGTQEPTAQTRGPIVYGNDDRVDAFDLPDARARALISGAMVALVPSQVIRATGGDLGRATTWGDADMLCPGEPFADQPSAAFCSGVLVDWDLVLTADHCTRVYALEDFEAVFDYDYVESGKLGAIEAVPIAAIVAEELDPEGSVPRLDYALLRLARPVQPPRQPAALYAVPPPLQVGDPVISVGTPGGVPMKWDAGGHIRDDGAAVLDYFTADADNSGGSSGGGAFDEALVLEGITARGGTDFVVTPSGCFTTVREPDGTLAEEQFTYAFRAVAGLCNSDPSASSLCRAECGSPCQALPPPAEPAGGGCALSGGRTGHAGGDPGPSGPTYGAVALLLAWRGRKRRAR